MSRLSQIIDAELKKRGKSERELAREFGWSQQAFNTWLKGGVPRQQFFVRLGEFLGITQADLQALVDEAKADTGQTAKSEPIYGKVTDRKEGKFTFPAGDNGSRIPLGRYAIKVDTKVMEPALVTGGKAWLDQSIWPHIGNDVLVHLRSGVAWIGQLVAIENNAAKLHRHGVAKDVVVTDVEAIHVIVLSERVGGR